MKMKRIIMGLAMVASASVANAQVSVEGSKLTDNWSVGIQGGVYQPTAGQSIFKDNRAALNIDIQKQITPIFGLGVNYLVGINDNNANSKSHLFYKKGAKTAFDFGNLGLNGLFNLTNMFAGYKGTPRTFEVVARTGFGLNSEFGFGYPYYEGCNSRNNVTVNFGLDFNWNLCEDKIWSINLKPGITYILANNAYHNAGTTTTSLNVNNSYISVIAGITYHFGNTNGTRSFVLNNGKFSQEMVDDMNDQINRLRAANNQLNNAVVNDQKTIDDLRNQLAAEKSKDKTITTIVNNTTTTQLAPMVIYGLGKKTIDAAQMPNVAMIATYMKNHPDAKVRIQGYASPEGNPELNQKLSEARAQAVYDMLVKKYGISKDRLEVKGMGVTDELFDENDWNRVATFIDLNPKSTTTTTTTTAK